ncbi:trypsin 3A1-like [Agrilus planipennis]|uniref:Trypsin 3A1-like n=1 Tax=Agrilus planipennis TaxID=224129 RepID=A0A1W4XBV3_AGRPL|nr:trypsin 3A1-like [Agrilus planipennis]
MNPIIGACLIFSLLGYFNTINAASIPVDVQSLPSDVRVITSDIESVSFDAKPVPSVESSIPSFGRIVGGSQVDINDYPYQIALLYSSSQVCGGSIISHSWILTAAHCITSSTVSRFSIRAGSNFRYSGGVTRTAGNIYVHARYSASTADFDISLISLQSALTFGATIEAVELPASNINIPAGTNAITTGWGDTVEDGYGSSRLRGVTVPVVSASECRSSYGTSSITANMICAGFAEGGRDACQGDSGGPLVASGYGQIGIVSWGVGCARPNFYGVYSSVPALRGWINSVNGL